MFQPYCWQTEHVTMLMALFLSEGAIFVLSKVLLKISADLYGSLDIPGQQSAYLCMFEMCSILDGLGGLMILSQTSPSGPIVISKEVYYETSRPLQENLLYV